MKIEAQYRLAADSLPTLKNTANRAVYEAFGVKPALVAADRYAVRLNTALSLREVITKMTGAMRSAGFSSSGDNTFSATAHTGDLAEATVSVALNDNKTRIDIQYTVRYRA